MGLTWTILLAVIFNMTSADFVLISVDVVQKMTTILKEMRIAQLCFKSERNLPRISTTSVKSVHKCYLCTDFTEVVENLGRSNEMKKCLNPLYASMVSCAKKSKNLESYLLHTHGYL